MVFLDKKDAFHPSDLAAHIAHTHPEVNFTRVRDVPDPLTLGNLDVLNSVNRSAGEDIYLTSTEDVTQLPRFLRGRKPDAKTLRTEKAFSCAVVVVEKGDGVVDAFYMYFYTFNRGPSVYGHVIGDHLGDWLVSFLFLLSSFSFPLLSSLLSHLFKHTSRANASQTQGAQHDPV